MRCVDYGDIVQGSEKAWIEVRRKDTEQVMEREVLIEGRDYEIDAIQGRIILRKYKLSRRLRAYPVKIWFSTDILDLMKFFK